MTPYKRLLKFLKPYTWHILAGSFCTAFVTVCTLLIAPLAGLAFRAIGEKDILLLHQAALGIIGLYLVKGVFTFGQEYLSYFVSNRVIIDLRTKIYSHIQDQSLDFFGKWHSGELISRAMNDINALQASILTALAVIVPQSILLVGLIAYIFWLNWRLSLLTLIALPLIVQVIRLFATEIRVITEMIQQKAADITTHLQETISQIRVVKAFTMEKEEVKKFAAENQHSFNINMRAVKILSTQNPVVAFLQSIAAVGIVWYGGIEIINGRLTLPQLISFATALGIMTDPGSALSKAFTVLQQGLASVKRITEVLDVQPSIVEAKDALLLPHLSGSVEFKDLSFAYENQTVLHNINLKVTPGESIALVGRTGAGKSTLVNLIPHFYDPTKGSVLVDGYDLKKVQINSLRRQIAVVPQEISLFRGTIKENIAYGKLDATEQEIIHAARQANAHPFIEKLHEGYNTQVGERGARLSGGERQRIAIARAILRDPRILILDEATSSLDAETEALIREALERLMQGRTTFIIAHRLYTIEKADRIAVIDAGKILEIGPHRELIAGNGLYKRLYEMQFKNQP